MAAEPIEITEPPQHAAVNEEGPGEGAEKGHTCGCAHDDAEIVYHALQRGAAGYLPKDSSRSEIVNAVLDCAKGRDVLAPRLASGLAVEIRRRAEPSGPSLRSREREVLGMIASGRSIPAIAEALFLAPSTV